MDIKEALDSLDINNDEQWTADGLPKVEVVAALVENDALKRSDIVEAAPDFNRTVKVGGQDSNAVLKDADGKVISGDAEVAGPAPFVFDPDSKLTEAEQTADYEAALAKIEDEVEEAPKTLLEEVESAFVEAQDELNEISKEENKLKALRVVLEIKCGYLGGQVDRLKKATGQNNKAIQDYLKNNRKMATEKAEARKALLESGFADVLKFVGPVALDAAMKQRKPLPSNIRRVYPSAITPDKT